jgi:adenylate cyclase
MKEPQDQHTSSGRRLAAILFADVAGYTALMQHDEQDALQKLARFKETLEAKTAEFQGQIIQYYGDGCLVVFDSPAAAVACAMEMQRSFSQSNKQGGESVPVRIGLHLGDVLFREGNVFGDSVNIASRVESLGVPGAVLLSQTVRRQIKNKPEFELVSVGSFEFKNVDEPMEVFAVANEGFPVPKREQMEGKLKTPATANGRESAGWKKWAWVGGIAIVALAAWLFLRNAPSRNEATSANLEKSIAVLPFKNSSTEEENQFFCDGVMEAVLDHLAKIEGLKVISRTSMERYRDSHQSIADIAGELKVANILSGSVQRQGGKVRISVQLIEAASDRQIWSDSYDRELTDIFNIQSEIAEHIAGSLKIELSPAAKATLANKPTSNLAAYDYYLKGREQLVKFFTDEKDAFYFNANKNFNKVLELDSMMAPAYADMALAFWLRNYRGYQLSATDFDTMRIYCEKALSIDPNLPQAHAVLGNWYLAKGNGERFMKEQEAALKINENYAMAYDNLGAYLAFPTQGDYEKGFRYLKKAIQLDPFSAWTTGYYQNLSLAYMHLNAFEEAEIYSRKVREAGDFYSLNTLVHLYVMQGKYAEAEALANEWRVKSPAALRYITEIEVNYHKNYKKAIELYKEYRKYYPDQLDVRQRIGLAYWLDGQKEKGRTLLMEALQEYEESAERLKINDMIGYDQAGVYATLGDTKKALDILRDKNCNLPVGLDYYIQIDPLFQNLWGNAEFQAIVQARQAEKAAILRKIRAADLKG